MVERRTKHLWSYLRSLRDLGYLRVSNTPGYRKWSLSSCVMSLPQSMENFREMALNSPWFSRGLSLTFTISTKYRSKGSFPSVRLTRRSTLLKRTK